MNCHCSDPKVVVWDLATGTFFCQACNESHAICAAVYKDYLCGEVDGHEGDHLSMRNKYTWNNQVYKMGP